MQARVILIGETESEILEIISHAVHEALDDNYHVGILAGGTIEQLNQLVEDNVVDLFVLHINNVSSGQGNETVKSRVEQAMALISSFKIAFQKPVIAISSNEDYKPKALEAGADKFIKVPFEHAVFQSEIRSLLAAGDC